MHIGKYKYEDWQPKITIKKGIEDFEPYEITLPTPPPAEKFVNYGLPPEQQFFVREEIPAWVYNLNRKPREQAMLALKANKYMAEWVDLQWRKRTEGIYIYINGTPYYIPGKYWFYLNYYFQNRDDGVGLADFRVPDLEYYLIWCQVVLPDPNIYGLIEWTQRRDGKTARACSEDLEELSKTANMKCGMQSKTGKDAKDTFQEFIVEPWRRLLFFFSPIFDNKTYPAKEINFRSPSRYGEDIDASMLEEAVVAELGSSIEVRDTVQNAFDGRKLRRYTLDEAGKIEEMDVYQAWRIHKQCLRIQQKLVGKAKITTTIEKSSKWGMESFLQIWDESDRKKLTALFQTKSGLVPLFKAAHESYLYDQYGVPIVNDATKQQAEYRKEVLLKEGRIKEVQAGYHKKGGKELLEMEADAQDNEQTRQLFYRMYPPSIRIARRNDGKDCHFPAHAHLIDKRLDELRYGNSEEDVTVCNLEWENKERFTKVIIKPCTHNDANKKPYGDNCPTCRFRFFYIPEDQYLNNVHRNDRGFWRPGNKGKGLVSGDTFKYDQTGGAKRSKASSHAFWEYDLAVDGDKLPEDQKTDDIIMEYVFRHPSKKLYGEDFVMLCWLLGVEGFPEINVPFLWDYLVEAGMEKFLKFRHLLKRGENGKFNIEESTTPGITTLGDSIKDPMFSAVENYLDTHVMRCKAKFFLQDCRDVEYKKLSPYDAFVSCAQLLYGRSMLKPYRLPKKQVKARNMEDILGFRVAGT